MTRLDSVIRRLMTQRSLLDWASREIARKPGLVIELGLGNGRTYDHLRDRLPGRDIYVFERSLAAHPGCLPPDGKLIIGDIFDTLPVFTSRFGAGSSILIHADLGSGDQVENDKLAARLSPLIMPLLAPAVSCWPTGPLPCPDAPTSRPRVEWRRADTSPTGVERAADSMLPSPSGRRFLDQRQAFATERVGLRSSQGRGLEAGLQNSYLS